MEKYMAGMINCMRFHPKAGQEEALFKAFAEYTRDYPFDDIMHHIIDLGTGGGLPGLILSSLTDCLWLLVDRSKKRCSFLNKAVNELDLSNRVEVVECSV